MTTRNAHLTSILAVLIAAFAAFSQQYIITDTLWVKVTYYDFHANSDFINPNCGTAVGQVQDYLDADRKPVLLTDRCSNTHVSEWFRPSGAAGASFNPLTGRWTGLVNYAPGGTTRPAEWVGSAFVPTYEFADVVLYDSLPFVVQDSTTGTYKFIKTNQTGGFWPLDGKAFGMESPSDGHNFGFTMEVHRQFEYQGGEVFEFRGDDDVWVFINGKLALDLGGMQAETKRGLNLDQVASQLGIQKGGTYWFDFFFTERSGNQSNAEITTNILTPTSPARIYVKTDSLPFNPKQVTGSLSDTLISAGDTARLWAYVFDDTLGLHPEWDSLVSWTIVDPARNPIPATVIKGRQGSFPVTEAYSTVTLYLSFQHPNYPGVTVRDTIRLTVGPDRADHLVIEASPDSTVSLRSDNPLQQVVLDSSTATKAVYAVLRDAFGNFVSASKATQWAAINQAIVQAAAGNQALGQGVITKVSEGQTFVSARNTQTGLNLIDATDSVIVIVNAFFGDTAYDSLRIAVRTGTVTTPISQLSIGVNEDTLLVVQGLRNGVWVDVPGTWVTSPGLRTTTPAPRGQISWTFVPTSIGAYTVTASYASRYSATINVSVGPGAPATLVLYPRTGQPNQGSNLPYAALPTTIDASAGVAVPLVAKLFDAYGNWISTYETDPQLTQYIRWDFYNYATGARDASIGQFTASTGNPDAFTPHKAYVTADIVCALTYGAYVMRDTIRIQIAPGPADHIVLEPDSNWQVSPNRDNPIDTIRLSPVKPTEDVYAVLRDAFGNFVAFSTNIDWSESDTVIATGAPGSIPLGQGIVTRGTGNGSGYVWATELGPYAHPTDSVVIIAQSYWYSRLRIVVNDSTAIDSLSMLSSNDTLVKVQGLRDDGNGWERIPADWAFIDLSLSNVFSPAPQLAPDWLLDPTSTGQGRIRVALGDPSVTRPDTLYVEVDPSPPNQVTMRIITPAGELRAGEPIKVVVEIRNDNGLVPGTYCYPTDAGGTSAIYSDTLGNGGRTDPVVRTSEDSALIGQIHVKDYEVAQCFVNGRDTVTVVLYYAPYDPDSAHKIFATLGDLQASTDPFHLLPGAAERLVLVDVNNIPLPGTVSLVSGADSLGIRAVGYDQWGNPVGPVKPTWAYPDLAQQTTVDSSGKELTLDPGGIKNSVDGRVIACLNGHCDTVSVWIVGSEQAILSAVALDTNGNGYIDRIDIQFAGPANFSGYSFDNVSISYGTTQLSASGVVGDPNRTGQSFSLTVEENRTNEAQTGWTPSVSFISHPTLSDLAFTARDGAGPVVWKVTYLLAGSLPGVSNAMDTLLVELSEEVDCSKMRQNDPVDVFNYYDETAGLTPQALTQATWAGTCASQYTSVVRILVPVGSYEITPFRDSLQLAGGTTDRAQNLPPSPSIAHKAPIQWGGANTVQATVGPNPFVPGVTRVASALAPSTVQFYQNIIARSPYGTLIAVTTGIPLQEKTLGSGVYGTVDVYDAVGNLVDKDVELRRAATDRDYGAVWEGRNRSDRAVGSGGYLALLRTKDVNGQARVNRMKIGVQR